MGARYVGLTSTFDEQRLVINAMAEDVDYMLYGTPNFIVGVITATSFVGNLTGTASTAIAATNAYGLLGVPNLNVGIVTASSFVGNLTGTASTAIAATNAYRLLGTPNLNVGIVTASSFIGNLTGTASTASASATAYSLTGTPNLNVGSVTASSFSGSGSGITGISTLNIIDYGVGLGGSNGSISGIDTTGTSFFNHLNLSGVITATSFYGSGANITGISTLNIVDYGVGLGGGVGGGESYWEKTSAGINTISNVGIGTTNPVTPLHVSDGNGNVSTALYTSDYITVSAQNTAPGFNIIAASDASTAHRGVFKATRARGTLASPLVPVLNDNTFSLLGAIYDGSTSRATAAINMDVDGTVGVGTAPQRISFWTGTGSSRLERARIQSTGELLIGTATSTGTASQPLQVTGGGYFSGSVGIGTTNPTNAAIHVEGRNFAFGGPGGNESGAGNLYLGNYSNPLNDPWDRNIRIGSRNEIQIEMLTDWGGTPSQYSDSVIFSSPDSFGIQYNNVRNGIQRSGVYPLYYSISTSSADDDNLSLFDNSITGKVNIKGSGEVLIGSATKTGTSNQKLQVTGGAYVSGNLGVGHTNPVTPLQIENVYGLKTGSGEFTATAGIGYTADSYVVSDFVNAEYTLFFQHSSGIQSQKVLVMDDGTTAYSQEYGIMSSNDLLVSVGATVKSGNVELWWTPETGVNGNITYRYTRETMI